MGEEKEEEEEIILHLLWWSKLNRGGNYFCLERRGRGIYS